MDPKQRLETMLTAFTTKGWKLFIEDIESELEVVKDIANSKNGDELLFNKGRVAVLQSLLNIDEQIKQQLTQLEDTE
jgi:hypothetical protein